MNSQIDVDAILAAVGTTKEINFYEFCKGLGVLCPLGGDKERWKSVLQTVDTAASAGFLIVEKKNGLIESLKLTEKGADHIRGKLDAQRGLFGFLVQ